MLQKIPWPESSFSNALCFLWFWRAFHQLPSDLRMESGMISLITIRVLSAFGFFFNTAMIFRPE
jgi:hypothetical protein